MRFQCIKSLQTLSCHSRGFVAFSNIYHSLTPTRILKGTPGPTLSKSFSSTVQAWQAALSNPIDFTTVSLHENTRKSIVQDFGYTKMSDVQRIVLTSPVGTDLLVRAKTGTGKTLAFMTAALERALAEKGFRREAIPIFVLSPTRELAVQIAVEAEKLVRHHHLTVRVAVGGTSRAASVENLARRTCDILVGTPGRLLDLISNTPEIRSKLQGLKVLVFDEADMLLEMGFRKDMEKIVAYLPKNRLTYMFSATLSKEIIAVADGSLSRGYKHIDCVPKDESDTHLKIKQSYTIVPYKEQMYLIQDIITKHKAENPLGKIILFCTHTAAVNYISAVLNSLPGIETLALHGKQLQNTRTRIADQFRRSRSAVLVTTDVSARGVDYPGVTLVLQVGIPSSRDQYVHRIGRTGRAGKEGEAVMVLSPFEKRYMELVTDIPIREELRFKSNQDLARRALVEEAVQAVPTGDRREVYISFMSFQINKVNTSKLRKDTVVEASNDYALHFLGLPKPPSISRDLAVKIGVANIPALDIQDRYAGGGGLQNRPPIYSGSRDRNSSDRGSSSSSSGSRPSSSYGARPPTSSNGSRSTPSGFGARSAANHGSRSNNAASSYNSSGYSDRSRSPPAANRTHSGTYGDRSSSSPGSRSGWERR